MKLLTADQRKEIAEALTEEMKEAGIDKIEYDGSFGGAIGGVKGATGDVQWRVGADGNIHVAGLVPSNQKSAEDYLEDSDDYNETNQDRVNTIELSRKAVKYEGVVATAIEAFVEIPTLSGWYIDEKNKELKKILQWWLENIDAINESEDILDEDVGAVSSVGGIEQLASNILWGLYENGDEVITERWENVPVPVIKGAKRNLPVRFISHDVTELTIDETLAKMNIELIKAEIDPDLKQKLDGDDAEVKRILEQKLPARVLEGLDGDAESYYLPPAFTTHFSRRNNRRSAWGEPYVVKAFPALAFKHRLRALDNATIDGLIQRIWIVKIGNDNPDSDLHIPNNSRVSLAVSAFQRLLTQNVLIWGGSDLNVEELGSSENNILSFSDRYKNADDDIQKALGIPRFLVDGEQGVSGDVWATLAKTISQMERLQIQITRFINRKMRQIAIENGYKDSFPKFHWMFLKLQNQERTKNIVTKLYELNLLGKRRSLHMIGMPADEIIEEMMREKKENLNEKLPQNILPYNMPSNEPGRPEDTKDDESDSGKTKPSDPDSNREGK